MDRVSDAFSKLLGSGLSSASVEPVVRKMAVDAANTLVHAWTLVPERLQSHLGVKLGAAALSGLSTAGVAVGAAGIIYVAVSARPTSRKRHRAVCSIACPLTTPAGASRSQRAREQVA